MGGLAWIKPSKKDMAVTFSYSPLEYYPSDPFCTPLSVAVEQRLNPVEQHVAGQPPS